MDSFKTKKKKIQLKFVRTASKTATKTTRKNMLMEPGANIERNNVEVNNNWNWWTNDRAMLTEKKYYKQ